MAIHCTYPMIGNYSTAMNFAVLITFFSTPIAAVLFPAFSKLNPQKEKETLRNVFQFSVKYAALLVVPAAALIALSKPIVFTLFGGKYAHAPLFLALIAISYIYPAFGSLSLGNLINSQGKTKVTLKLTLITATIGFPLSLPLIPKLGIIGLIITTLTAGTPSLTISLRYVKKHFTLTISWASSAKILLASTLAAIITYAITSQLSLANWTKLIIGATLFLTTYTTTAPLTGAKNKTDIQKLREMPKE
jgi:O-antigen/teichoic acid export membrane protein